MALDALAKKFFPGVVMLLIAFAAYFQASGLMQLVASSYLDAAAPAAGATPRPAQNRALASVGNHLGAMTAAQLYDAAKRAVPGIPAAIARGDFTPLMAWLGEHVHGQGSRWSSVELLTRATGKPLDPAIFKAHLERRYLA